MLQAEIDFTSVRLRELEEKSINGNFDFKHLKAIHKYIFQDLYEWAGKERHCELSKSNSLFCTLSCLSSYAESIFNNYYPECKAAKTRDEFISALAKNYGDLNALHPFREGNGRAQREFARELCEHFGYAFDLNKTTHEEMVRASKFSLEMADSSLLRTIFQDAIISMDEYIKQNDYLQILSMNDLNVQEDNYEYYYSDNIDVYNNIYKEKIKQLNSNKKIREAKEYINNTK